MLNPLRTDIRHFARRLHKMAPGGIAVFTLVIMALRITSGLPIAIVPHLHGGLLHKHGGGGVAHDFADSFGGETDLAQRRIGVVVGSEEGLYRADSIRIPFALAPWTFQESEGNSDREPREPIRPLPDSYFSLTSIQTIVAAPSPLPNHEALSQPVVYPPLACAIQAPSRTSSPRAPPVDC